MTERPTGLFALLLRVVRLEARWIALFAVSLALAALAGWVIRGAPGSETAESVDSRALPSPPARAEGVDGLLLREGGTAEHIEVIARRTVRTRGADGAAYFDAFIRDRSGAERWVGGERVAVRSTDAAAGLSFSGRDFDSDGRADLIWHAATDGITPEDEQARRQGYLVFEGSQGIRLLSLAEDHGWGSSETIEAGQAIERAGSTDLLVILSTSAAEVGSSGRRLVIVRFDDGRPRIAVDHFVNDPVCNGLGVHRVGRVWIRAREIVARSVVHDWTCGTTHEDCVHVEVDRWSRDDYTHTSSEEPLRDLDGAIATRHRGDFPNQYFSEGDATYAPERAFLFGDRWVEHPRFEPFYEEALAGVCANEEPWGRWVVRE
jgi:hypothetical protein